ncbi:MAG: hypothetical protein KDJ88_11055 [Bauldia sp.]|nr:hypothetical protein [Bauldia sp.]
MGVILIIIVVAVVAALAAHLVARRLFDREIEAAFAGVGAVTPVAVDRDGLPPPVRAFAERNTAGRPDLPREVRLIQAAEMKLKPDAGWTKVSARQAIGIGAPAFAWDANATMAPLVSVRVIDAFVEGEGRLKVRLFGSVPMVTATGPEASYGELFRYLAELAWAPHAILANPALRWRAIDGRTVEVAADTADGQTARVRLIFDTDGDVVAIEADDRPRDEGGKLVPQPWRGTFGDYRDFDGIRIPTRADVTWITDAGPFTYFRGEVVTYQAK